MAKDVTYRCDVRVATGEDYDIDPRRGTILVKSDSVLEIGPAGHHMVEFRYPLSHAHVFELVSEVPLMVGRFIQFVCDTYKQIYAEEDRTLETIVPPAAILNRGKTDGKYGIWGHGIGDLVIEGFHQRPNGVWELHIGS